MIFDAVKIRFVGILHVQVSDHPLASAFSHLPHDDLRLPSHWQIGVLREILIYGSDLF